MAHKLKEVKVDPASLLAPGLNAEDMYKRGEPFIITSVLFRTGDMGEYAMCRVEGEEKDFKSGAQNIVAKLKAATAQGLLPLEVTVSKHGNAYDIQ